MVLNEKEMQMARDLGGKLVKLIDTFKKMKEAVLEIWNDLRDKFVSIVESIINARNENDYHPTITHSWNVPKNIKLNHQVLDRTPLQANIRNRI